MLAILGGGIAGLAAAAEADRLGLSYQLFEATSEFGGNARTFEVDGFRFDAGAHRLHDRNSAVTTRVNEWLEGDMAEVHAPSRIRHGDTYLDFPLTPGNLLRRLKPGEGARALASYALARIANRRKARNFQELCYSRFGRALADPFLIRYSEKLWGAPASELSTEIAGRRLDALSLRSLFVQRAEPAHLEGSFFYPTRGIGAIAEALAKGCSPGSLHTGHAITAMEHDGRRVREIVLNGQTRVPVHHVISTLPLAQQSRLMRPAPKARLMDAAAGLLYRHVIVVAVFLKRSQKSRYASTYYPDADVPFTRVHEPNARSAAMSPEGCTSLVAELVRFETDADWTRSDADLVAEVTRALARTGALEPDEIVGHAVRRLRNAYPVLRTEDVLHAHSLRESQTRLSNLELVGRAATFRYLHIHDLIGSALASVQRIAGEDREQFLEVAS
ncbi:UDP-galactopyranose mutase [Planctomycetes bacterium Poly30]|uniref:UDP-galactopyranose mutase n=1 Tax=Saltatorellus ferox TaxID=2528018 RepID=A0A518EYK8_9BACT|nr:UDP-galactopyranose mutase [Planctomycetes bacterium Poly30]